MIEKIRGMVESCDEMLITLMVHDVGFSLSVPGAATLKKGEQVTLYTYLHWNQEKGPSLYGFNSTLDRELFLLIIQVPKIGPSVALTLLNNITPSQILEAISTGNERILSAVNGIGPKKAEQLVMHLKHKVDKLLSQGKIRIEEQQDLTGWHAVSQVLSTLNYSRQEISGAMRYLSEKYAGQSVPLDQLIRAGLSYLSKGL